MSDVGIVVINLANLNALTELLNVPDGKCTPDEVKRQKESTECNPNKLQSQLSLFFSLSLVGPIRLGSLQLHHRLHPNPLCCPSRNHIRLHCPLLSPPLS